MDQELSRKDIVLRENLTVHLDECVPGTGWLDCAARKLRLTTARRSR